MIPIKLSQLPQFSGDSSGSYIVINDANNAVTYIVNKESFFTASLFGTASYASSAGTASYIDAGGVVGLNLSRIASGSATASISPGLFNVNTNTNIQGNLTASSALFTGDITAQRLVVQTITSSVSFVTGSTKFGSFVTDTHQFTGSLSVSGSSVSLTSTSSISMSAATTIDFTTGLSGASQAYRFFSPNTQAARLLFQGSDRSVVLVPNSNYFSVIGSWNTMLDGPNTVLFSQNGNATVNYFTIANDGVANVMSLRQGTAGQTLRIYNTYTSVTNYERAKLEWTGSVFNIGTEQSGSGVARDLALQTSGVTRLFISSSGVTFLNTPTSGYDISTGNGLYVSSGGIKTNGNYRSTTNAIFLFPTLDNTKLTFNASDPSLLHSSAGGSPLFTIGTSEANGSLRFLAGNTEALRIFSSSRNITIQNGGVFTDAGFRLDVNGTARIQGLITSTAGLTSTGGVLTAQTGSNLGRMTLLNLRNTGGGYTSGLGTSMAIAFTNRDSADVWTNDLIELKVYNTGSGTTTTGYNFYTHNNQVYNANPVLAMSINGASVGIGTETPSASLHISGSTGALFEIDSNTVNNILYVSSSGNVSIGTTGSTAALTIGSASMVIGSNLGYGTTYGSATDGLIQVTTAAAFKTQMWFRPSGNVGAYNSNYWSRIEHDGGDLKLIGSSYGGLGIYANNEGGNGASIVMPSNVATTNLNSLLNINGPTNSGRITLTTYGSSPIVFTGTGMTVLIGSTTGSGHKLFVSGSDISGSLNADNTLYVSGSRVGIGTRTPSALLDVEGTTQMNTLQLYTPSAGGLTADIAYDGNAINFGHNVNSTFGVWVRNQRENTGIDGIDQGGGQFALRLYSNGAERSRITFNGNLLVGTTTNSGFRLDVSGSARVTNGMQVSSSLDVSGSIVASAPSTLARITATSIGGAGITITGNAGSGQPGITTTSGLIHIVPVINGTGGNEVLAIRKSATGANIVNFQSNAGVVLSTITGDGSLALNKSSSNGTLDVSGSALISGSLSVSSSLNVNDTATFSKPYTNTSDLGIVVTSSIAGINLRPPIGRFSIISGYNTTNSTTFVTSTGTSNPSVAMMYFDHSTGNVGINQTLPGFRLDVNGTARVNGNTQITGSLLVTGSMTITSGSVTMPNRPAFRVSGSGLTGIPVNTILSGSAVAVDYNQGGHYNNTNGKFTAPIAGLYHVYFNSRTQTAGQQQVVIYKNTSIAQMMWETNADTGHFGVSSILNLAVNDTIEAKITVGTIQFDGNDSWGAAYIG